MSEPTADQIAEALAYIDLFTNTNHPEPLVRTTRILAAAYRSRDAELRRIVEDLKYVLSEQTELGESNCARYAELRVALDSLAAAPDVVEQGWRNPSVEMPEEEQRVDIWIIHPNWTGRITDCHWQKDGGWYDPDGGYGNGAFLKEDTIVVAWMPLPAPPVGQEPS